MPVTNDEKISRATALRQVVLDQLNLIELCATNALNDSKNISKFKMSFKNLKKMQREFEKHHNAIIVALAGEGEKLKSQSVILNDFSSRSLEIETIYHDLVTEKEKLHRTSSSLTSTLNQTFGVQQNNESVCLPKIDLPYFTGDVQKFSTFIEMFDALVHNSRVLSNIEKFNYLLSKLSGPPLALIKNIHLISDNYLIAYKTLKDRYDNKRLRAVNYWKAIENCPTVTKDNFHSLRHLIDTFTENLEALRMMQYNVDTWDFIITNMLLDRLDSNTRKAFEQSHASNNMPLYNDVKDFLLKQCNALETVSLCSKNNTLKNFKQQNHASGNHPLNQRNTFFAQTEGNSEHLENEDKKDNGARDHSNNCILCKGSHIIYNCPTFLNKNASERFQIIKNKRACVNCLASQHITSKCTSQKRCRHCKKSHHSLLHFLKNDEKLNINIDNNENISTSNRTTMLSKNDHEVLLSTVLLNVHDAFGNLHKARAVIDPGSQSCFVQKRFADKLGLSTHKISITLQGLEKMCMPAKSSVHCTFSPIDNNSVNFKADFIILEKICDNLPSISFNIDKLTYLKDLNLADPEFNKINEIQLLLGADIFPFILADGRLIVKNDQPACLNTVFGWIVMGRVPFDTVCPSRCVKTFFTNYAVDDQLDNTLKLFWKTEEVPEVKIESPENNFCENYFINTIKHNTDNSFTVSLPFKINAPDFGDTRSLALRRFLSLERRLLNDKNMYTAYADVINDYLQNGHMEQVQPPSLSDLHEYFYIAHHAVIRKESTSTPLRVVMDASSHAFDKISLNQALYTGPKLQRDLVAILLNFRIHKYVMIADIRQMFRMIWVDPKQRNFQRILWRFTPESPVLDYQINVVIFGVTCSPYLAIRTLLYLANSYADLPLATEVINTQSFVDDISFGHDDIKVVMLIRDQLIKLLGRGRFELRKWAANSQSLLEGLPESHVQNIDFSFDPECDRTLKILGLKWSPTSDSFYFPFTYKESNCSKRILLSELARIFDPLGILTPITFFMKLLIQHLWTLGLGWDEIPPSDIVDKWLNFKKDLNALLDFSLPRHIDLCNINSCQLIGFCDASIKGTCAVTYLRIQYKDSKIKVFFLYSKSKVAPLQTVSLPRLELSAALLLSKLMVFALEVFKNKIEFQDIYAFSDSTVALSWIRSSPHMWKTFIANRVSFIQERVPPGKWHHVVSKDNAADCGSRGLFPSELICHTLWWNGPRFLLEESESWKLKPPPISQVAEIDVEKRISTLKINIIQPNIFDHLLQKFSSLNKIKRVLAYVLRFINISKNCKSNITVKRNDTSLVNCLTNDELLRALILLVKHEQHAHFSNEILLLKNNEVLPKRLKNLNLFLTKDEMIRVGGRLCNADLHYDQKFPLLLPARSILTKLIINDLHFANMHSGIQTTLYLLTQKFWVLSAKKLIRKIVGKCFHCWKSRPISFQPLMGNLPAFRVREARPFLNVGVDLAGPYTIKMGRLRNAKCTKAWICLFVCCTTKALHIELLSELSTEAFLAGFRRLIGRRGICANVYSDCGTNFVGANNYLKQIYSEVAEKEAIKWHFNPPAAPHMGGLWEANIKSVKTHLKRVIGLQVLTYEELNTVLIQIEAVLNSRPLTPLSSDPRDLTALTPAHFLVSGPITTIPEADTTDLALNKLSRWQLLVRMRTDFWNRWKNEYLHTLTQRAKWHLPNMSEPSIGTMVLIKNENTTPLEWSLGRITELIKGADNICRVAVVKTTKGLFKRPLVKLCPLPIN